MAKVADLLEKNMDSVKDLLKAGVISTSYMNYFKIYVLYKSSSHIRSKMDRYQFVADTLNQSSETVRKAIKQMEKNI